MNKKIIFLIIAGIVSFCFFSCDSLFSKKLEEPIVEPIINIPVSVQPVEVKAPELKDKPKLENKDAIYLSDEVYYERDSKGKIVTGYNVTSETTYNAKPILSVTQKGNGFEIKKYHDPIWWYIDIYVYDVTENKKNARLVTSENDNKDVGEDTYFYPFVKAGNEYKIYIVKQDMGYQNWKSYEDDAVYITALNLIEGKSDMDGFCYSSLVKKGREF